MGRADHFEPGSWNAICAMCGRKGKASEMRKLPGGIPGANMYVHTEHYVARNPQDFVRGIPEKQSPPWTQPQPGDTFIGPGIALATEDDVPIFTESLAMLTEE